MSYKVSFLSKELRSLNCKVIVSKNVNLFVRELLNVGDVFYYQNNNVVNFGYVLICIFIDDNYELKDVLNVIENGKNWRKRK